MRRRESCGRPRRCCGRRRPGEPEPAPAKVSKAAPANLAAGRTAASFSNENAARTPDLAVSGSGRYVRLYGTKRATPYGYSLWEIEVYAPDSPASPPGPANPPIPRAKPAE